MKKVMFGAGMLGGLGWLIAKALEWKDNRDEAKWKKEREEQESRE